MKIVSYVLLILLPGLILLTSFRLNAFDKEFYDKEFVKYNIYQRFDKNVVDENVGKLINYLNGRQELDTDFFNEKEKSHLQDVRRLVLIVITYFYVVSILSILIIMYMINKRRYKDLGRGFMYGGGITLLLLIIIISMIVSNFDKFFLNFHLLSFNNDLWQLNPATDNLIVLFPEGFFFDMGMRIFIMAGEFALLLIFVGIISLLYNKRIYKHERVI